MCIKMILYVIRVVLNRFQVDTGSTSGFAQKILFRIFKYMKTCDSCIEKASFKGFEGR